VPERGLITDFLSKVKRCVLLLHCLVTKR
jgi:hypothetical protein